MILDLHDLALRSGDRFESSYPLQMVPLVLGGVPYEVLVPGNVAVVVERVAGGFLVEIVLRARVYGPCSRCLEEAILEVEARQQEFAPTAKDGWQESDLSTFVEDLVVDVDGIAREALVLALPGQILCSDSCRGLCPQCGCDLNQGACECRGRETDERWNKLKDLRLED